MKKYILLDHEPWTINSQNEFYRLFENADIKLIVWDLSNYIHPGYHLNDEVNLPEKGRHINNYIEFQTALKEESNENNIVIVECIPRIWKTRKLFKLLSQYNIPSVRIESYGNTLQETGFKNIINKILSKDCINFISRKLKHIAYNYYAHINNIKGQTLILSSNSKRFRTYPLNHPDYEKFRFGKLLSIVKEKYIVFSDIYFPLHPDYKYLLGVKNNIDPERYYRQMRDLFDKIESQYNLPVIIAAHPKSAYKGDEFGGRKIIKYKTDNLIANSEAVLFHYSCTLSYVALFNKPIAFIHSNLFEQFSFLKNTVAEIAKSVDMPFYTLKDQQIPDIKFVKLNETIRNNYIYSYLTSPETKDIPNSETIKKVLSNL